jgi:hypothetical protein
MVCSRPNSPKQSGEKQRSNLENAIDQVVPHVLVRDLDKAQEGPSVFCFVLGWRAHGYSGGTAGLQSGVVGVLTRNP